MLARGAWAQGMTPGAIVRGVGAYPGQFLITQLAGKKFNGDVFAKNIGHSQALMMEYIHQIFAAPERSGEHALQFLIAPPDWQFYTRGQSAEQKVLCVILPRLNLLFDSFLSDCRRITEVENGEFVLYLWHAAGPGL